MSHPHPELTLPPALPDGALRVVALGGLGEVGRNMAVLEHAGRLLVIDCGVLFPEDHQPGVDLILPDFEYIKDRLDDIEAIVLTHGHEDHIGAVPYLLRLRKNIPLVGSRLTLAFIEAKLKEHRIQPVTREVREGQTATFGGFECEFVAVNHSIPDALAVAVHTAAGTVLHTGDFKMDQLPLDGRITDLRAFARLGERGVDLFMVDSTNAEVPGFVAQERGIGPVLDQVFADSTKRIIVASFASHVHRVQQVLDAAYTHQRRVALVGRSMVRNMGIAADLGYLKVPDGRADRPQAGRHPARRRDRAHVHRLAGRADGGAVPDRQQRPQGLGRPRRHRDHGVVADPRERERRLPRDQRPDPPRRARRALRQRQGARLRARQRRRAPLLLQHPQAAQRHARARRDPAPRGQRGARGADRHPGRPRGARRGRRGGRPDRRPRAGSSAPCPAGTCTSTGPASGRSPRSSSRTAGSWATRASSRSSPWSAPPTARCWPARRSTPAGSPSRTPCSTTSSRSSPRRWRSRPRNGNSDAHVLQQVMRRVVGRWVSNRLRRRPMIIPVVVEA